MKEKLPLLLALLAFPFCYMEWGGGNSGFVYEAERQILFGQGDKADSFAHPLVLLPFLGQLLLLWALFQQKPNRRLVIVALCAMGLLVLVLLLVGILGRSPKIVLSTLPFLAAAGWWLRESRRSAA
jgi:hypothetical protein